jgi:uncharacterized protein YjiS (DUF1127 family)
VHNDRNNTSPGADAEGPLARQDEQRRKTMTSTTIGRKATRTDGARSLPDFLSRVSSKVVTYVSRSRAERQLQALDDRLLADIGMRRSEIQRMVWGA